MAIESNKNYKKIPSSAIIYKITELIKKYGLGPVNLFDDPDMQKILSRAKSQEERLKIVKDLPFDKIVKIVKEVNQGKISMENLPSIVQERLDISQKIAKKISEELKKNILSLVKIISEKKEKVIRPKEPSISVIPRRSDVYRESVE